MTRSFSSACSWPPSRSWPGSGPCSPTKAMTPSTIASYAASSVSRPRSTSVGSHPAQDWASAASPLSAAMPGCSRISASPCATIGSALSSSRCCRLPVYSWLHPASQMNCENRLLELPHRRRLPYGSPSEASSPPKLPRLTSSPQGLIWGRFGPLTPGPSAAGVRREPPFVGAVIELVKSTLTGNSLRGGRGSPGWLENGHSIGPLKRFESHSARGSCRRWRVEPAS